MISLRENGKLFKMLCFMFLVVLCAVMDVSEDLRDTLQLVPLPNEEFQQKLITTLVIDFILCNAIETTVRKIYLERHGYTWQGRRIEGDKKTK